MRIPRRVEMDRGASSLQGCRTRVECPGGAWVLGRVEEENTEAAESGGDEGDELGGDAVSCSRFASRSSHVLRRGGTPGSAIERGEGG